MSDPPKQQPEFDAFSSEYEKLIHDPIRERFAGENRFFFESKIEVIQTFFRERGRPSTESAWLDVGCGQGDLLRLGQPHFKSVAGCDPSEGMLKSCSGIEVRHQTSDDRLPFDDSTFDFITAVCVYHHVPVEQRLPLTLEIRRLLKPRGIVCIIEHNPMNPVTRLVVSRSPVDADASLLPLSQSKRLLSSAKTKVLDWKYFLFFPKSLHGPLGSIERRISSIPLGGQYSVFAEKLP